MADGAGPYEDGDSPPPHSHSHADYAFDEHRENGDRDRDRKREVMSVAGLGRNLFRVVLWSSLMVLVFFVSLNLSRRQSLGASSCYFSFVSSCGTDRNRTSAAFV